MMGAIDAGAGAMYALLFISLYFEVFLLVSFLEQRSGRRVPVSSKRTDDQLPRVGIVVPCYNEARTVSATITSLLALDYPREKMQIIVVDDGSRDNTYDIAQTFASDIVQVYRKENGGKHTAMNFALEKTDAEFIGCLDADSIVEPSALREIVPVFENPAIAAVTPGIHVRNPQTLLQHMQNVEYRLSLFNRFTFAGLGSLFIAPGPFSFFRTSVVRELGAWRYAHSTEDMEMALRMQDAGFLLANAPRAIVHTTTPRTFPGLFRQRVRWTYGWLRNAIDYRHMMGNHTFGNLGLIILPSAIISIGTGIYFFARLLWYGTKSIIDTYVRVSIMGIDTRPSYDFFYFNTSAILLLVGASVVLILILICAGSLIGTGSRKPPASTPLFLLFYSFLAPLWLSTALVRACFKTGVRWR
jgi:cellulose synthase/poly-beta-1,6-N-acetylglucosamine synthase-like glycosyltransferase